MGHHWTDVFAFEEAKASVNLDGETHSVGPVTVLREVQANPELMRQVAENREQAVYARPILKPLRSKLIWVGVDLDGTLAEPLWTPDNPTSEIGDPIPESLDKINELVEAGYKIIIHTSRPWTDYQIIEQWLNHYEIPFKEIQCGKPLYAAYIDDRAIHAEAGSWLPNG
jgi:hypothetical protein